jgi:hypothetical protein
MRLKAISPFIASVLLISFTIASGIIIYYFITTLPRVQTTEVSSQASKVLSCAGATFDVKVRNCNLLNGLVLWLPMDEGSGNIAYDYSGNNNNGTYYGYNPHTQSNSTLLYLTGPSPINLTHYFYLPSKAILSDVNLTVYYKNNTLGLSYNTIRVFVNGNYVGSFSDNGETSTTSYTFVNILKSNFTTGALNSITYEGNVTNITQSTLKYLQDIGWVNGKFGKALSFDGIDDWVKVNHNINFTKGFTVCGWIFPIDLLKNGQSFSNGRLFGQADGYFGNGGWHAELGSGGSASIWYRNSSNYAAAGTPAGVFKFNNWVFICTVYDTNFWYIYVNGSLSLQHTKQLDFVQTTNDFGVMHSPQGDTFVKGYADEVRIYNRALSEEEIKQLYYNGLTNKFNITIGLLNLGFADLGKSFNAVVYLKNGTILQLPLILDRDLNRGSYLEKTLTIDGYYPSYGLVDKVMVCSNDCQGVCSEIIVNNQC